MKQILIIIYYPPQSKNELSFCMAEHSWGSVGPVFRPRSEVSDICLWGLLLLLSSVLLCCHWHAPEWKWVRCTGHGRWIRSWPRTQHFVLVAGKDSGLSCSSGLSSGTWTQIGRVPLLPFGWFLTGVWCLVNRQGQGLADGWLLFAYWFIIF